MPSYRSGTGFGSRELRLQNLQVLKDSSDSLSPAEDALLDISSSRRSLVPRFEANMATDIDGCVKRFEYDDDGGGDCDCKTATVAHSAGCASFVRFARFACLPRLNDVLALLASLASCA